MRTSEVLRATISRGLATRLAAFACGACSACFDAAPTGPEAPATSSSGDVDGTSAVGEPSAEAGSASGNPPPESSSSDPGTGDSSDVDGGSTTETGVEPGVIGPLFPLEDRDDGAIYPAGDGYSAHWYPSGEDNVVGRQYFGEHPTGRQYYGYFRFELPEALPAGTVVESAVLVIHGHDTYAWDAGHALRVWAHDSVDAAAVSGVDHYPGRSIPLTRVSVRWPEQLGLAWVHPGANATPDLSPLVQSVIDEFGGLAAGAHLQLWVGEDVVDGDLEELGWLDSIAGADTAPSLTLQVTRPG